MPVRGQDEDGDGLAAGQLRQGLGRRPRLHHRRGAQPLGGRPVAERLQPRSNHRAGARGLRAGDVRQDEVSAADPHIVLVPSIWPETYCYVLSGALRSGRRIAVFDLGAQAERARQHDPQHLLLPLVLAERPDELADRLLAATQPPQALRAAA